MSEWPLALYDPADEFSNRIVAGEDSLKVPAQSASQTTTLHINMQISGFALKQSLSGFLSLVVLVAHLFLAGAHITLNLIVRRASTSWNAIPELLAWSQGLTAG
jgi:hypothetical protein